ncbi:MAG: hypothetical protein AAB969_00910 [Patescibacteria group bacterium]
MSKISIDNESHEENRKYFLPWENGCEIFQGISLALSTLGDFGSSYIEVITATPMAIGLDFASVKFKIVLLKTQSLSGPHDKIEIVFILNCKESSDLAEKVSSAIIKNIHEKLSEINMMLERDQKTLQKIIAGLPLEMPLSQP